jgi:hypothetical protein
MSRPTTTIVNAQTGETETRPMNDTEFAAYEAIQAELEAEAELAAQKATAKAVAEAKLEALGLTPDDLAALGL